MDRGDVYYAAEFVFYHVFNGVFCGIAVGVHVGVNDSLPFAACVCKEWFFNVHACVIDEEVDSAEAVDAGLGHIADLGFVGDVGLVDEAVRGELAYGFQGFFGFCFAA